MSWPKHDTVRDTKLVQTMTAILVVEDDPDICGLLADVLEAELAARVRCERTGSLAMRAIETAAFSLAIIDVNLPEISGYELAMRAADRNIPVLLSSGHPDTDAKLQESGCRYLAKPYPVTDLIGEVAMAITHPEENIRHVRASLASITPPVLKSGGPPISL